MPKFITANGAGAPFVPVAASSSPEPYNMVTTGPEGAAYTTTEQVGPTATGEKGMVGYRPSPNVRVVPAGRGRA